MKHHSLLLSFLFAILFTSPLAAEITTGIEGYVYLDSEETPAQGVNIDIHSSHDFYTFFGRATTDADGYYAIELAPCTSCYKVHYNTQGTLQVNYVNIWNENKIVHENADPVSVQSGKLTSLANTILTEGKKISGTVRDENNLPVQGVYVQAYDKNGNRRRYAETNALGVYTIRGLFPDEYILFFNALYIPQKKLISSWYDDELNEGDAHTFDLKNVDEFSGIDATLYFGGDISGTVTNQDGPVQGAWIGVYDSNHFLRGYVISTNGSYTITGLPDIDLYVHFFEQNYKNQGIGRTLWYDQVKSFSKAQWVTVGSTGIDAHFEPSKAAKLLPVYQQLLLNP